MAGRASPDSPREQDDAIEALRRAEQDERGCKEELQHFLDTAVVPIHTVDKHGVITWANQAELDLLGYTREEYIGHSISAFLIDTSSIEKLLDRLLRGEIVHDCEIRLRAKNGTIHHVLASSRAHVKNGEFISTRCFLRDITERKRIEQERDQLIEDLSRTVRLNETFASVLAHDLRNPLNTILVAGQLAMAHVENAHGERVLQRLLTSAKRMQLMVEQLLDFARIRTGGGIPLECRPTDIGRILRDVVEEIRLAHPDAIIESHATGDLHGAWDGDRIAQLISNVVANAVQHGEASAPVEIHLDGALAASVVLSITNAGTIREDQIPLLFSPYRGAHRRTARSQGLGLGLFISDQIVRAHGGTLRVISKDGWTECTISLPRAPTIGSAVTSFDGGTVAPPKLQEQRPAGPERADLPPGMLYEVSWPAAIRTHTRTIPRPRQRRSRSPHASTSPRRSCTPR